MLSPLQWDESYSVGLEDIDQQHQSLVELINRLISSSETGSRKEVTAILTSLVDYTVFHFQFEEEKVIQLGYEEFDLHKASHDKFRERIVGLHQNYCNGETIDVFELISFLRWWVINHIYLSDKKMFETLRLEGKIAE